MRTDTPKTIRLKDYRPPDYLIDTADLDFGLGEERTRVRARLAIRSNYDRASGVRPLVLDGQELTLISIALDGRPLGPGDYALDAESLTLPAPPARFTLETETEILPQHNTALEGLYKSGGSFVTQCEAEGFRKITYFIDRPDVTAIYTTRITADRARYPVLLSNGNLSGSGDLSGGRHWAAWHDPFRKPSYLFALVAGGLAHAEGRFTTKSGREVAIRVYVEPGKEERAEFAVEAVKRAMRWDEETFGLEYDLDCYMIVAVADFNMGAMENKGLNIFNDKYVLVSPETATDADYAATEGVIAHEYFHNWTGNRVTLRDWFQLSLKEGLTVFRDQAFSADMRSHAVKRISDVRLLRARQFPEDDGPLAHPVRPDSYIEINNFYTATVYEKGAEVVRMVHTLLGRDGFREGLGLYLRRHDGEAATVEDFIEAMEEAGGIDLGQFRLWYDQAGTPEIEVAWRYDAATQVYELTLAQTTPPTPGQPEKAPLHIPFAIGLLDRKGREMPLRLEGEPLEDATAHRVLSLRAAEETFRFVEVMEPPVPSLLRGFSAPVKLRAPLTDADRAFLMAHDPDLFNRWEAGQQYAVALLLRMVADPARQAERPFLDALGALLEDRSLDAAFVAEALALPSETYLGDRMAVVDVEGIHRAREALRRAVAGHLKDALLAAYRDNVIEGPYSPDPTQAGRRRLRNAALGYLATLHDPETAGLCRDQYRAADNMTDSMAALAILSDIGGPAREEVLADFYARWKDDPLVIDKWLAIQATAALPDTLPRIEELLRHPAFSMRNPNKVRALIGAFAGGNQLRFHAADGAGYAFVADQVLELNRLNPQVASRLLTPFGRWHRFDAGRQALMRAQLERILAAEHLSPDVYEIASKSLG